jgi:multimeric flavodoxin WrbA
MQTILGIIGSPRKLGNCEIMVKEISRQISVPHELNLLRLPDFDIQPCKGCYTCLFKDQCCPLEDDFYTVLDAITNADALIVAAPTYFLGANACLKRLLDRGLAFYAHTEKMWGKPSVGVGIAGINGKEGYTLLGIESFLKLILTDVKQSVMIYGALPGEVFLNDPNKKAAADLASALFAERAETLSPACPVCGGSTFRFLENNRVRCMLCSNSGQIDLRTAKPVFDIHRSDHELFLTKEDVLRHKEWLVGMKARFMEKKKALKEISLSYRKDGNWVIPCPHPPTKSDL